MKLWHCVDARSFRALWTLEELEIEYDLIVLDFPPRNRDKQIFDINPLGTVPVLVSESVVMTESSAICEWLAEQHPAAGLSVAQKSTERGAFLNWLHLADSTLTFPQTIFLRYSYLESVEQRQPKVADDYKRWYLSRLKIVAAALETKDYLCEGRFTVADIAVGYALSLSADLGIADEIPQRLLEYLAKITDRDGWRRAKSKQSDGAIAAGVSVLAPARRVRVQAFENE